MRRRGRLHGRRLQRGACVFTPNANNCVAPTTLCDPVDDCIEPPECEIDDTCPGFGLFCEEGTCEDGTCAQAGSPCIDDGASCTSSLCDEDTDQCFDVPDDLACDDDDECTVDTCNPDDGAADALTGCVNENIVVGVVCDDGVDCTNDTCDPADGCENTPDNGNCPGDGGDQCNEDGSGTCDPVDDCEYTPVVCANDDGRTCTVPECISPGPCTERPDDTLCEDGDPNTLDVCVGVLGDDPVTGCDDSVVTCDLLCAGDTPDDCGPVDCGIFVDQAACLAACSAPNPQWDISRRRAASTPRARTATTTAPTSRPSPPVVAGWSTPISSAIPSAATDRAFFSHPRSRPRRRRNAGAAVLPSLSRKHAEESWRRR